MTILDRITLLITGLIAIYTIWRLYSRYSTSRKLYDLYYMMGFIVLLISGLLLIFLGWDILSSPFVLTVATLIPLGISMGLMNQYFPKWKKAYAWFALIGLIAIAITSVSGSDLKKIAVPVFHGIAGLIIFLAPIKLSLEKKAPQGFWWVGVGGALIGLGGIALAFLVSESQLLFFSQDLVMTILAPLLLMMTLAFGWGFTRQVLAGD